LAEDLRRFAAGRPILARRFSAIERTRRWSKRIPLVAGAAAVVGNVSADHCQRTVPSRVQKEKGTVLEQ
jgi:hypothetical protein